MAKYSSFYEFKQLEDKELERSVVARGSIAVLMSVPTLFSASSKGFAIGAAVGAPFGGIGAIPGAMIGGILGGLIGFAASAIVSKWLLPKLANQGMKLWRYLRHGSEEYRYLNHLAQEQTQAESQKMMLIAKQFKSLHANHIQYHLGGAGLTDVQKKLFKAINAITVIQPHDDRVQQIMSQDPHIQHLIKARQQEVLTEMRSHKRWAQQTLKHDPAHPLAQQISSGISAGHAPLFSFGQQVRIKPQAPRALDPRSMQLLQQQPQQAVTRLTNLVQAMLAMDEYQITNFSEQVIDKRQAMPSTQFNWFKANERKVPFHEIRMRQQALQPKPMLSYHQPFHTAEWRAAPVPA